MTAELFKEWLDTLNKKMRACGRNILLFVDNCTAHPKNISKAFSNIQIAYFPPDTTSVLQPMDQGVIFNLKSKYRRRLQDRYIRAIEKRAECNINVLDGINMIHRAWCDVSSACIANCFSKAGFELAEMSALNADSDSEDDDIPLTELMRRINSTADINIDEFINVDNDVATCATQSLDDIVANMKVPGQEAEEEEDEDTCDETFQEKTVPNSDVLKDYLADFYRYFECQNDCPDSVFNALTVVEKQIKRSETKKMKQRKIEEFFSKQN